MKRISILAMGTAVLLGVGACKDKEGDSEAEKAPHSPKPKTPPKAQKAAKPDESGIAWIENDYEAAIKQARQESKPLVIDMWADWCHTCLAMKKGTLRDRGLAAIAKEVIWLAVDTEHPSSAAVMDKFPPNVWPTFLVVSPNNESIQATQLGSCSVREFREFVERGSQAHLQSLAAGGELEEGSALAHLRSGDRAWANDAYQEAADHYAAARKAGGEGWGPQASTTTKEIAALQKLEDKTACATLASSQMAFMATQHNSSGVGFLYYAANCAEALKEAAQPEATQSPRATALLKQSLTTLRDLLDDEEAALSYDDRSDALAAARAIALNLADEKLAEAFAVEQLALLNRAVEESATALEEMTYIWHQVEVHAYLGLGAEILPWVESLEAKLPEEYDPPYRRGWLLLQLKRYAEAHEAVARALTLAKGARRGRILGLDAAIYKAEGNTAKERESREAVVACYENLEKGLASPKKLTDAKKALAAMDAAGVTP